MVVSNQQATLNVLSKRGNQTERLQKFKHTCLSYKRPREHNRIKISIIYYQKSPSTTFLLQNLSKNSLITKFIIPSNYISLRSFGYSSNKSNKNHIFTVQGLNSTNLMRSVFHEKFPTPFIDKVEVKSIKTPHAKTVLILTS